MRDDRGIEFDYGLHGGGSFGDSNEEYGSLCEGDGEVLLVSAVTILLPCRPKSYFRLRQGGPNTHVSGEAQRKVRLARLVMSLYCRHGRVEGFLQTLSDHVVLFRLRFERVGIEA